jgi:hypothetical protein
MENKVITEIKNTSQAGISLQIYNDIRFVRINDCVAQMEFLFEEILEPEKIWVPIRRFNTESPAGRLYANKFSIIWD